MLAALEQSHNLSPDDKTILKNIIFVCKDNIQGISYRNFQNVPQVASLSPEYEAKLKQIMKTATRRLQTLNPEFKPPEIKKASAGCATLLLGASVFLAFALLLVIVTM
jgi:hypothetical protein